MSEFVTDTHPLIWYLTKDKRLSADVVPGMPDRLIAATAVAANAPLLSRDHKITAVSNLTVIW
ncbi:MAG: hypothetical protein KBE23_11370 [Chloroflexi bacterium]|nr:hypothetical protein [Chloroflexota bacterium]MBP7043333.1 hypothetical protein [Chloroflexota bacterium]